jgi:hypothetical protein
MATLIASLVSTRSNYTGLPIRPDDQISIVRRAIDARVAGWVARAAVADLRQQLRVADLAVGVLNSDRTIAPSGCSRMAVAILPLATA